MPKPTGFITVPAKDPKGHGRCNFRVPKYLADRFLRAGPAHKYWDLLYAVPQVLLRPTVIYEGLERPEQDNGLCYAGIPPFIKRETQKSLEKQTVEPELVSRPPPEGMVFAVFVTYDYIIFEYRGYLSDWESRFKRKLWSA